MATRRKTKGRRQPWACGHKGFGLECHRCAQANELETRANELAQALKTKAKTFPGFVTKTADANQELESGILVKGGGQRVFVATNNKDQNFALSKAVELMREHATRLKAKSENKVRVVS